MQGFPVRALAISLSIGWLSSGCADFGFPEDLGHSGGGEEDTDPAQAATSGADGEDTGGPTPSDDGGSSEAGTDSGGSDGDGAGSEDAADDSPADTGDAPPAEGLPCEIQSIVWDYCGDCHGVLPQNGAEHSMLTRSDLLADSMTEPGSTIAEVALSRFTDGDRMPPLPHWPVLDERVAQWAAWVGDGMPAGECMPDSAPDPYEDDSPGCVSGQFWNGQEDGDSKMDPGEACVDCHQSMGEGPPLRFAGTVFNLGHEPDDCYGINGNALDARVMLLDSDGDVLSPSINSAGNFYIRTEDVPSGFSAPWKAKVVIGDQELFMDDEFSDGDCNACHSMVGDEDAPGRIVAPY